MHPEPRRGGRGGWSRALWLLSLLAAPSACNTGKIDDPNDLSVAIDLRRSPGNLLIGLVCDDTRACPAQSGTALRCAVAQQDDRVGFCAVPCTSDTDCDTVLPGRTLCTRMVNTNRSECVIFCGANRACPTGWSCIGSQGYNICQPPQTTPDMSTPADMANRD